MVSYGFLQGEDNGVKMILRLTVWETAYTGDVSDDWD